MQDLPEQNPSAPASGENSPAVPRRLSRRPSMYRCLSAPGQGPRRTSVQNRSLRKRASMIHVTLNRNATHEPQPLLCRACSHFQATAIAENEEPPADVELELEEPGTPSTARRLLSNAASVESSASLAESECFICFERMDSQVDQQNDCFLLPCEHHQLCFKCATQLSLCPLCRQAIDSVRPRGHTVVEVEQTDTPSHAPVTDNHEPSYVRERNKGLNPCVRKCIFLLVWLLVAPATFTPLLWALPVSGMGCILIALLIAVIACILVNVLVSCCLSRVC